jgi:hypothetical protein
MANTLTSPTGGFQTFGRLEGGSPTAGLTPVWVASTDAIAIFRGDPVITSPSSILGTGGSGAYVTSIQNSSAGNPVRGIFQGCEFYQPTVGRVIWSNFWPGATAGSTGDVKAYIVDDPQQTFLVQGSSGSTFLSSHIGLNVNMTTATTSLGNTATGLSNTTLQSTTTTAAAAGQFRLVDFYSAFAPPGIPNVGTAAFINGTDNTTPANMVIVRLNNCDRLNLTARSS